MTPVLVNGLVAGCRYALLAFGFGLVYFSTGIFHFAHGAIYAVAGFALWWLIQQGLPFPLASLGALLVAVGAGVAVEVWLYRPLRDRRAPIDVQFLTSLGIFTAVANLLALGFGQETRTLAVANPPLLTLGGSPPSLVVTRVAAVTVVVTLLVFAALWLLFRHSRFGLQVRAYAANPTLAEALGIESRKLLPAIAALAAGVAAVASGCVAADVGISPQMGLEAVVIGAVAVVVGGVGSFGGTALAGLVLGLLKHTTAYLLGSRWEEAVTFALLLAILLFRPRGLFGRDAERPG